MRTFVCNLEFVLSIWAINVFAPFDLSFFSCRLCWSLSAQSFAKTLETLSQIQADKRPLLARQFLQLASDLRVATHSDQRKVGVFQCLESTLVDVSYVKVGCNR